MAPGSFGCPSEANCAHFAHRIGLTARWVCVRTRAAAGAMEFGTMTDEKHEHGKMDIEEQERAFSGFMRFATNTVIGIAVFLILLYAING